MDEQVIYQQRNKRKGGEMSNYFLVPLICTGEQLGTLLANLKPDWYSDLGQISPAKQRNGTTQTRPQKAAPKPSTKRRGRPPKVAAGTFKRVRPVQLPAVDFDKTSTKQAIKSGTDPRVLFLQQLQQQGIGQFDAKMFRSFMTKILGQKGTSVNYHLTQMQNKKMIKINPGTNRANTTYSITAAPQPSMQLS